MTDCNCPGGTKPAPLHAPNCPARSPAVLAPVDVGFSDQSTASPEEKARRALANMACRYSSLFFGDGFPRDVLHTDALAAKRVFEQMAADLAAAREEKDRLRSGLTACLKQAEADILALRQRAEAAEAEVTAQAYRHDQLSRNETAAREAAEADAAELREAARTYWTRYCQDEAGDDGEHVTGCSRQQHLDARWLGEVLALQEPRP